MFSIFVVLLLFYALVGAVIGMLSGWLTTLALKSQCRLGFDAGLGAAVTLLSGLLEDVPAPGPQSVVPTVVAFILPVIYELWRWRRAAM